MDVLKKWAADMVTKAAMDAAIAATVKVTAESADRTGREIRTAERDVRLYVGDLAMAYDSASDVYRSALSAPGVRDAASIHESALKAVLETQPRPGTSFHKASIGMDGARTKKSFDEEYPGVARIRVL